MLECRICKAFGIVEDATKQELKDASKAQSEPYLWEDNLRVVVWGREQRHP